MMEFRCIHYFTLRNAYASSTTTCVTEGSAGAYTEMSPATVPVVPDSAPLHPFCSQW